MEAVKVQDVAVSDLPWTIEYHAERCTLCGSCLASCTFGAIKPVVRRQSVTVSEGNQPKPAHRQIARTII
ncbi:MAG: 4Fe-4S binding protein, partial [Schwartzia sp.]|nr:4Fe-4S binding protein [Schwartzia sp. (in: firmicutes)]